MHSGSNEPIPAEGLSAPDSEAAPTDARWPAPARAGRRRHRLSLSGAVITTATKLLPLVELLEAIQPHVANESVFRTRRRKINAQIALAYAQLQAEKPRRKALLHAFKRMSELVVEETRDISKDELKQAAKEVVVATLKNAPGLISAAHQARLLS